MAESGSGTVFSHMIHEDCERRENKKRYDYERVRCFKMNCEKAKRINQRGDEKNAEEKQEDNHVLNVKKTEKKTVL